MAFANDEFAEKESFAPSAATPRKKTVRTFAFVKSASEIDVVAVISGFSSADLRKSVNKFAITLRAKSIPLPLTDEFAVIVACAGLATTVVAAPTSRAVIGAKKV